MGFMLFLELILLGVGLAADAFAVSVCKGLAVGKVKPRQMITVGLWFGGFQALMPTIGYYLGQYALEFIESFDHWIAFVLLALIGANMIREAFSDDEDKLEENGNDPFAAKEMVVLAVATSIDALAVGIALAMMQKYSIGAAAAVIGVITFVLSAIGLRIGAIFGDKYKKPSEIAGGIILILIGLKILLEHLGVIAF